MWCMVSKDRDWSMANIPVHILAAPKIKKKFFPIFGLFFLTVSDRPAITNHDIQGIKVLGCLVCNKLKLAVWYDF